MHRSDRINEAHIHQAHILANLQKYLHDESRDASFIASFKKEGREKGHCLGFANLWEEDKFFEEFIDKLSAEDSQKFYVIMDKISKYGEEELSHQDKQDIDLFLSRLKTYNEPSMWIPVGSGDVFGIEEKLSGPSRKVITVPAGKAVLITDNEEYICKNLLEYSAKAKIISISLQANILNPVTGIYQLKSHRISIYRHDDGSYALYDSNLPKGEMLYPSGEEGLKKISNYIANWNKEDRQDLRIGLNTYNKFLNNSPELKSQSPKLHKKVSFEEKDVNKALIMAAFVNDKSILAFVLSKGGDVNYRTNIQETALQIAVVSNSQENVNLLIGKADQKNIASSLYRAAKYGRVEIGKQLIDKLAEFKLEPKVFKSIIGSAICHAAENNQPQILEELLKIPVSEKYLVTALGKAIVADAHSCKNILIDKGININASSIDNMSLLASACLEGNVKLVSTLLELKANPNSNDESHGLLDSLELLEDQDIASEIKSTLLRAGAKPRPTDNPEALKLALMAGDHQLIRQILENKADPNRLDNKSAMTPLMLAVMKKDPKSVELLLEYKPRIDKTVVVNGKSMNVQNVIDNQLSLAEKQSRTSDADLFRVMKAKIESAMPLVNKPEQQVSPTVSQASPLTLLGSQRSGRSQSQIQPEPTPILGR